VGSGALFIAVFLACLVERSKALTIVLAAGTVGLAFGRFLGVVAGVVSLGVIVAAAGPALTAVPLTGLRVVVGGLLLILGLQWRPQGDLARERRESPARRASNLPCRVSAASAAPTGRRGLVGDWYSFTRR